MKDKDTGDLFEALSQACQEGRRRRSRPGRWCGNYLEKQGLPGQVKLPGRLDFSSFADLTTELKKD
jgi:hypothetical protein